jgi:16S rRNA (cytosine967-C5)-methyltransferase
MTVKQAAILRSAARLLKPGGRLVYATCSLLPAENETIAQGFTAEIAEFRPVPVAAVLRDAKVDPAGLTSGGAGGEDFLRLWPHRHGTDGFFAAVWQRG